MGKVQSTLDTLSLYSLDSSIAPPSEKTKIFKLQGLNLGQSKPTRSLSFVELPEIEIDQLIQYENIGWGSTGEYIHRGIKVRNN